MKRFKTSFCHTCSLQPDPALFPNKPQKCWSSRYPNYVFYSFDKFMRSYFPNTPQPTAQCDAVFIGKKSTCFIEQKAQDWFYKCRSDAQSLNTAKQDLYKKCIQSITNWRQFFPIGTQETRFVIVFSDKIAHPPLTGLTNSLLKNFIRQRLLANWYAPIPVYVRCCNDLGTFLQNA